MNRGRMLLGLGVALVVAFLASSYVYRQLKRVQSGGAGKVGKQVQVVVAAGPLKLGQRLTANDLALLDWPEGKQPQGSLSRPEDCVGRALIVPLVQGEVVLDQALAKREAGEGLSVTIPEGMRAVSVGVDDVVAVAGFVTPGTIVDVLVTGMGPTGPVTRTILEHVRVLAVGQELETESGKPQTAPVVTLLVNPEDGEKLTLASADGKIHLALRNTVDVTDVNTPPVYGSTIFFGTAPAAAPRVVVAKSARAAVPFKVEVIRGDKVEIQTFPR
ncbi:MAG: Flp pilus assembly protein CpaB [Terriglobia bacterium]